MKFLIEGALRWKDRSWNEPLVVHTCVSELGHQQLMTDDDLSPARSQGVWKHRSLYPCLYIFTHLSPNKMRDNSGDHFSVIFFYESCQPLVMSIRYFLSMLFYQILMYIMYICPNQANIYNMENKSKHRLNQRWPRSLERICIIGTGTVYIYIL